MTMQPREPNRKPSLKEGVRDLLEIIWSAFTYTVDTLSGSIVVGGVMMLALFAFTEMGLRSFWWWAAAMLISLLALIAYERWRSRK
jgi:hypothetical protein